MPGAAPGPGLSIGFGEFTLAVDDAPLNKGLERAQRRTKQVADQIGKDLHQGSMRGTMGLLALSQAIDDAQYGFRAIVNNIPQVISMFGLGAGLAGVVGIAAVAVNQMINHWEQLANLFRSDFARTQAEYMAELAAKTQAAADETERLLKAGSAYQQGQHRNITEAIIKADPQAMFRGIEASLLAYNPSKVSQRGGEFYERGKFMPITEERARMLQAKEREAIANKAKTMMGSMATDPLVLKQVIDMMRRSPENFPGMKQAMEQFKGQTPEELAKDVNERQRERARDQREEDEKAEDHFRRQKLEEMYEAKTESLNEKIRIEQEKQSVREAQIAAHDKTKLALPDDMRALILKKMEFDLKAIDYHPAQMFSDTRGMLRSMQQGVLNDIPKQQLKEQVKGNNLLALMREDLRKLEKERAAVLGR